MEGGEEGSERMDRKKGRDGGLLGKREWQEEGRREGRGWMNRREEGKGVC